MEQRLAGRTAIVTGAHQGIGRAIAERLVKEGAYVALVDVNPDTERVAAEIAADGQAEFYQTDVSKSSQVEQTVAAVLKRRGSIDILVNNTGITGGGTIAETTEKLWDSVMAVNLKGMFLFSKFVLPSMQKSKRGSIINISSVGGVSGGDNALSYCTSKWGVVGLSKSMAIDHAKEGIRVNVIGPGFTETPMMRGDRDEEGVKEVRDMFAARIPMGRVAQPKEIAAGAAFLASDDASFVTGAVLMIDGGNSAKLA